MPVIQPFFFDLYIKLRKEGIKAELSPYLVGIVGCDCTSLGISTYASINISLGS